MGGRIHGIGDARNRRPKRRNEGLLANDGDLSSRNALADGHSVVGPPYFDPVGRIRGAQAEVQAEVAVL